FLVRYAKFSFFFSSRRRHTRFSRDWSSDVCSSDFYYAAAAVARLPWAWLNALGDGVGWLWRRIDAREARVARRNLELAMPWLDADRKSGVEGKSGTPGGRVEREAEAGAGGVSDNVG